MKNGRISDVKGGGLYGEGMRLLQKYPGTQDMQWPHHEKQGYWWLYEAGMGTNPKYFKHPVEVLEGINLSERNVAGVIHWAFGSEAAMGPDKIGDWAAQTQRILGEERRCRWAIRCTITICFPPSRCGSANSTSGSR